MVLVFDVLARYEQRLSAVERKVENTRQHSSQPPSSDGLQKGPAQPRQRGEKPLGGHPGHSGATRAMVDTPDAMRELRPHGLCPCGARLDGLPARRGERRQPIEIPEPKTVVTEFRQRGVECPGCGGEHRGEFPAGVTPTVRVGPRLKAYAVGLVQGHCVALERTCELSADQDGVQPSDGAVQHWILKAGELLTDDDAAHQQSLLAPEVVHWDESGMRIGGQLNGLHVAATDQAVYDTVHAKRGQEARDAAGILPHFHGHAVHDPWKSSWSYTQGAHSLCQAQHVRELRYGAALTGHGWPGELRRLLVEGQAAVADARAAGQPAVEPARVKELLARDDQQVQNGLAAGPVRSPAPGRKGRVKQQEATNLWLRLRDYQTQVWRFLTDWRVPFDNNVAERPVRPVKVKLQVIGGCRALGGSTVFCVLRSVWETNKLNGINPFDTLRLVFEGR